MGWPAATLGAKVTEAQAWQDSGQEPARSHALPDSFTVLTQSFKITTAMTSRASLVWWAGCMLWNPEPGGPLSQAMAGVAGTLAAVQGCLEPGPPHVEPCTATGLVTHH